jgi:hypothetical protein
MNDSGLQMHVPMYQKSALTSYNCRGSASATISPFLFVVGERYIFSRDIYAAPAAIS